MQHVHLNPCKKTNKKKKKPALFYFCFMLLLCILPFFSPVPFSFPSCLSVWTLTYCTCTIITEVARIWNMLVMYAAPVAKQSWPRAEPPDSQSSASGARYTPGVLHAGSTTLPPAPSVQPPARSPFGLARSQAAPVLGLPCPASGVLYTNSLSFLKLISRVIGPHKKSWQDKLILLFGLMANIKPHQFATIACGMVSIVAGFRLVLKHNISTLSPLFTA